MAFKNSAASLKALIILGMTDLLPEDARDKALPNLDKFAGALADAMESWIIESGANAVQVITDPGQVVQAAAYQGSTTGPGTGTGSLV